MTPKETFQKSVVKQINGNRNHGWGQKDSEAVIAAIWESETGEKIDANVMALIADVINPSAFRQKLEKAKLPGQEITMLQAQESKKRKHEDLFKDFVG